MFAVFAQPLLAEIVEFLGPEKTLRLFGIKMVGLNADNAKKLGLSLAALVVVWVIGLALRGIAKALLRGREDIRAQFWSQQATHLLTTALLIVVLISIWFSDPARLATAAAMVSAGLAFALQRVITAVAAYFVILHGRLFNVGDRITMGGVRGDVIALGYIRTTVMEMAQPAGEQKDPPSMWVHSRQFTGRIVTITNDKIFDEPVYNYTYEFPFLWEEMQFGVGYKADYHRAEEILLEVLRAHTEPLIAEARQALERLRERFYVRPADLEPRVYLRMTDNWIELAVRFISRSHGSRELKDKVSREIAAKFAEAGIEIASTTFEVVGVTEVEIRRGRREAAK